MDDMHPMERVLVRAQASNRYRNIAITYRRTDIEISIAMTCDSDHGRTIIAKGSGDDWESAEDNFCERVEAKL